MIEYFLPMIMVLGLYSSYTDIKTKKVSNKIIILSLVYAFVIVFLLNIATYYYIIGLFLSVLFSLILWYADLWPAGDAKLFIAYSSLVPFLYDSYFSWAKILLILFLPIAILYTVRSLTRINNYKNEIKIILKPKNLLEIFFTLFAVVLISLSNPFLQILPVFAVVLSILVRFLLKKVFKQYSLYIALLISMFVLFFKASIFSLSLMPTLSAFVLALIIDIVKKDETSKKRIALAPLMFLAVLLSVLVFYIL